MSTTARSERPISRWISVVRPSGRPLATSRAFRSPVEAGSIPYSAVTQPRPRPRIQAGTLSSTDAVQITRVRPTEIRALPSAVSTKPGRISTGRSWSGASSVGSHRPGSLVRSAPGWPDTPAGPRPPLLAASEYAVVLTGAGISTESGIPDFRSAGGVWERVRPDGGRLHVRPSSPSPSASGASTGPRIDMLSRRRAQPGPPGGRRAGAARHRARPSITQNIDRLHAKAGSSELIEVHGVARPRRVPALRRPHQHRRAGGARRRGRERRAALRACGFPMKSGVVLFGEPLPGRGDRGRLRPRRARRPDAGDRQLAAGGAGQPAPAASCSTTAARSRSSPRARRPTTTGRRVRLHGRAGVQMAEVVAALDAVG